MLKRLVALVCCAAMLPAAWGSPLPLGSVDISSGTTLSGVVAEPGATVFNGDIVATSLSGGAGLGLLRGSYAALPAASEVRLLRREGSVAVEVQKGAVILTVAPGSAVEGLIGNASFRPVGTGPSAGVIEFAGMQRVVFYAEKGTWIAATEGDGRSIALPQGHRLEATVVPGQTNETSDTSGAKKKKKRKAAFLLLFGAVAVGTGVGLGLSFERPTCPIRPFDPPGCPVASPVLP